MSSCRSQTKSYPHSIRYRRINSIHSTAFETYEVQNTSILRLFRYYKPEIKKYPSCIRDLLGANMRLFRCNGFFQLFDFK